MDFSDLWHPTKLAGDAWNLGKGVVGGLLPQTGAPGITPQEQQLLEYNKALAAREQGTFGQQSDLSKLLFEQAQGQGPSLAGLQLGQGLEQINRNQMSMAAGAGGENGVLARYAAMQNAAQGGAAENQQLAAARANEVNQARALLGQNLGNQAQESGNMYATNLTGFTGLRGGDINQQKNSNDERNKLLGGFASAASGAGLGGLAFA